MFEKDLLMFLCYNYIIKKSLKQDRQNDLVTRSVSLPPWLNSLGFHFVLIESVSVGLLLAFPSAVCIFIN